MPGFLQCLCYCNGRRMNKKYFIAGIALLVVAATIAGFLYTKHTRKGEPAVASAYRIATSETTAPAVPLVKPNPASSENWQTYTSEKGYFSVQYPSQWTAQEHLNADQPSKWVTFSGDEGNVTVNWGSGFGGACGGNSGAAAEKITIGKDDLDVCHTPKNTADSETWTLISKDLGTVDGADVKVDISAGANAPAPENRDIVLKVLQSLQFQVK